MDTLSAIALTHKCGFLLGKILYLGILVIHLQSLLGVVLCPLPMTDGRFNLIS